MHRSVHRSARRADGVAALLWLAFLVLPASAAAQDPVKPDSAYRLPEIEVTVTRRTAPLERLPAAIGVLDRTALTRGQQTLGLDEALTNIPGVYVANRYNYSLDQRLSIRGAGSRANFGTRGVKILLDGIPQTLPDGQSQLTNVEFGLLDRVEVLRGPSSALYGNASGGVLSLQSLRAGPERLSQAVRFSGGAFGTTKGQSITTARSGQLSGVLSLSWLNTDGFRQNSAADSRLLNLGVTWDATARTALDVRLLLSDAPEAQNPGALTQAEYNAKPDTAAGLNILRGADKDVSQQQLAVTLRHRDTTHDGEYTASVFGLLRDLKNPLATPPPGAFQANAGTYVAIDRAVGGVRLSGSRRLGTGYFAPKVTIGVDAQRMRDDRQNFRSLDGQPTDSVLIDQQETVTEAGPFAHIQWSPTVRLTLAAGGRHDWVTFDVDDHHLTDGVDNSGHRPLSSWSASGGASYFVAEAFVPYVNVGSEFETPTTTELANQPNSSGGFNSELDPQRTTSFEVGARGRPTPWMEYSAAFFTSTVKDAIVQFREVSGRAYFTNAGQTSNDGLELGLSVRPIPQLRAFVAFTYSDFIFDDYKLVNGAVIDTLDGNRLPAVPKYFTRIGLRAEPYAGIAIDVDHTLSSSLTADDANGLWVDNWGAGVSNIRLSWAGPRGTIAFAPFLGVNNAWDRQYISAVTVNGAGGRVFEPAPRRNVFVGAEVTWRSAP